MSDAREKLNAAAPELLKALEALVPYVDDRTLIMGSEIHKALISAKKAIAHAKGQSDLIWEQATESMLTASFGDDGHWLAICHDGEKFALGLLDEHGNDVGEEVFFDDLDAAKAAAQAHGEKALEEEEIECRCRHCGKIVTADDCLVCDECE